MESNGFERKSWNRLFLLISFLAGAHAGFSGVAQTPVSTGFRVAQDVSVPDQTQYCQLGELLFRATGKCYGINTRGPCPGVCAVMIPLEADPREGICGCTSNQMCSKNEPTIFLPEQHECYNFFEEGPCPSGSWLVPSGKGSWKCERIPCNTEYLAYARGLRKYPAPGQFLFPYNGQCYLMRSTGFPECPDNIVNWYFDDKNRFQLRCGPTFCPLAGQTTAPNTCADGTIRDPQGACNAIASFD